MKIKEVADLYKKVVDIAERINEYITKRKIIKPVTPQEKSKANKEDKDKRTKTMISNNKFVMVRG